MARPQTGRLHSRRSRFFNPVVWISLGNLTWIVILLMWIFQVVRSNERLAELATAMREESLLQKGDWGGLVVGIVLLVVLFVAMVFVSVSLTRYWSENRAFHAFVSTVSHELRTPLASIRLYLETMQAHADLSDAERAEFTDTILADVERLSSSIDAILEASRLERRGVVLELEAVDLAQFLGDYHGARRRFVEMRRRNLTLADAAGPIRVLANRDALTTVLNNLIENAVRYSNEGSAINLHVGHDRHRARLEVTDQGLGISGKEVKRIFRMFFRGASSAGKQGTGLGLYIVQGLVRAMRGEVQVKSEGSGKGTTFSIGFALLVDGE